MVDSDHALRYENMKEQVSSLRMFLWTPVLFMISLMPCLVFFVFSKEIYKSHMTTAFKISKNFRVSNDLGVHPLIKQEGVVVKFSFLFIL